MPKIARTAASASARGFATLTPPHLPRPPAWICALTTTTSVPACCCTFGIAAMASSALVAAMPIGTGTPYCWNICLPWYSWIFTSPGVSRRKRDEDEQLGRVKNHRARRLGRGVGVDELGVAGALVDRRRHRVAGVREQRRVVV